MRLAKTYMSRLSNSSTYTIILAVVLCDIIEKHPSEIVACLADSHFSFSTQQVCVLPEHGRG